MRGNSPEIESSQQAPHRRLADVVRRHAEQPWRAPLHAPSVAAFERWAATVDVSRNLYVDLGCGTGDSTLALAARWPEAVVLGVDQSAHRLRRHAPDGFAMAGTTTLMRAEAATVLRCLQTGGFRLDSLFLLYPNPWPKPEHLMRRWHAHPVFPTMLAVARRIVLRTNWRVYADEHLLALAQLGWTAQHCVIDGEDEPMTPFECKYRASGHACFEVTATPMPTTLTPGP